MKQERKVTFNITVAEQVVEGAYAFYNVPHNANKNQPFSLTKLPRRQTTCVALKTWSKSKGQANWMQNQPFNALAAFSFSLLDYNIIIQYIFIKINQIIYWISLSDPNLTKFLFCFLLDFCVFLILYHNFYKKSRSNKLSAHMRLPRRDSKKILRAQSPATPTFSGKWAHMRRAAGLSKKSPYGVHGGSAEPYDRARAAKSQLSGFTVLTLQRTKLTKNFPKPLTNLNSGRHIQGRPAHLSSLF